ncbi:MAG TPA: hypothetical protein VHC97_27685 [Thermoanaerobaculia bacterium]|jgi:hypothetical protein|nr:hypothetical protein [Thermoanaerobaculia bacterium]
MKKKTVKKLALAKETLIPLENNLDGVAGGVTLTCEYSGGQRTCATCARTCTTNLC